MSTTQQKKPNARDVLNVSRNSSNEEKEIREVASLKFFSALQVLNKNFLCSISELNRAAEGREGGLDEGGMGLRLHRTLTPRNIHYKARRAVCFLNVI